MKKALALCMLIMLIAFAAEAQPVVSDTSWGTILGGAPLRVTFHGCQFSPCTPGSEGVGTAEDLDSGVTATFEWKASGQFLSVDGEAVAVISALLDALDIQIGGVAVTLTRLQD